MASETSGDFMGVCEHPARIPMTTSASEAKYTGKVLILDLLKLPIKIPRFQHEQIGGPKLVLSECTLYCRTLLPNYLGGLGTCPVLAWKSAAYGLRCRWRQSG